MTATPPVTTAEFKARFKRDFIYGTGTDSVTDGDITNAFNDALTFFNSALFTTEDGKLAFLYASAHFLVTSIQAAGGLQGQPEGSGIDNQAQGILTNKSVGGVSVGILEPPDFIKSSATLQQFWATDYGRKYLAILQPRITGNVSAVEGRLESDVENSPDVPFADY